MANIPSIPGQAVLPSLEEVIGFGAITNLKPSQEVFAWEYVLNNSNAANAYKKAYPGSAEDSSVANACRLLKSPKIQKRIVEIRAELHRRYEVTAEKIVQLLAMSMSLDRRQFVDSEGNPLELHELPAEAAAITDIQIVFNPRTGKKHALPVVPERVKAGIELAKMMGITKEKIELTGPSGGVNIYIPDNNRDSVFDEFRELAKKQIEGVPIERKNQ